MQNHYIADIGDFGKYGLLKFISSETKLKLGINWYLSDGEKNNDGKFYDYLMNDDIYSNRLKNLDTGLYNKLKDIINEWKNGNDTRNVQEIKNRQILGGDIDFYEEFIENEPRRTWCKNGFNKLSDSEIVFFDPDNGLIINEEGNNNIKSPKHIYSDEIIPYFQRGQSLILYQHATREKGVKFDKQLERKALKLRKVLNTENIITIRYKRRIARAYFIIPSKHHYQKISSSVEEFMKTKWGQEEHFVLVYEQV